MKYYLYTLILLIGCTGCFSATPLKQVPKEPIPVETEDQKELERQAIYSISESIKQDKAEDALILTSALQVKSGQPTVTPNISEKAFKDLGDKILKGVKDYRNKLSTWQEEYSSYIEFSQREKTTGEKAKSVISWTVIILIIWAVLAPSSLAVFAKWIHGRVRDAKDAIEEEFEKTTQEKQKLHKASNHTYSGLERIKSENNELWVQIKPYLKTEDLEVESTIREVLTNSNTEALEKR